MQLNALVPARIRHLTRFREIATILARHGLGYLLASTLATLTYTLSMAVLLWFAVTFWRG